jgi:hypothetical protein
MNGKPCWTSPLARAALALLALIWPSLLGGQAAFAAPPAQIDSAAERPLRFSVVLTGTGVRHLDDSYRVLGDKDDHEAVSLQVTYELRRPGQDSALSLGLGLVSDKLGPSGESGQLQADLQAVSYYAVAVVGFRRERTVQPFLSLAAGFTRAELTIERSAGNTMDARDYGAFGRASGGIRVAPSWLTFRNASKQPRFGAHVSVEAGALLGSRLTFDVTPDGDPDTSGGAAIRVDSVRAGDVMPTALFGGVGLGVSF